MGVDNDGDIILDIGGKTYYLVCCPITGDYWLMDAQKTPCLPPKRVDLPLVCRAKNYACHSISKNGCASIVKTMLWQDGKLTAAEKRGDRFIWRMRPWSVYPYIDDLSEFSGKRFIVLQPEIERIMRWINWLDKDRYCRSYDFDLPDALFVDQVLWSYPHVALNSKTHVDQHAMPQKLIADMVIDMYYHGSIAEFKRQVDIVPLQDLADYHADVLGVELLKNNITPPQDKRLHWQDLTAKQKAKIETIAAQYPLDFLI